MKTSNRALLLWGFMPAGWFLAFVTIGGWLAPGYNPIAQQASELTLLGGAPRFVVDFAALGTAVFLSIFGIGLWRASGKPIAFGALAWILFGLSMASNGIWIMGSPMHGAYGLGLVVMIAPALSMVEARRLSDDGRTYWITGLVSFLGVIYFWLNLLGFDPTHYRGLTQRIYAVLTLLWPAWAAYRLLYTRATIESRSQIVI
jgi:hypothetical protein